MDETDQDAVSLTREEARVLGCLLEKAATTPDLYPLTLNSLLSACNQKTNRNPVVEFDEDTVAEAIKGLREKQLAFRVDGAGSRVPKYRHNVDEKWGLGKAGKALLAVLLLRGPQTTGELRMRTERMHIFPDVASAEKELDELADELDPGLWKKIPPAPGQKEPRYRHLLYDEGEVPSDASDDGAAVPAVATVQARNERIAKVEARVAELQGELASLREAFETFRREFE